MCFCKRSFGLESRDFKPMDSPHPERLLVYLPFGYNSFEIRRITLTFRNPRKTSKRSHNMDELGSAAPLERRTLGKTGEKLSILGFAGLLLNKTTPEKSSALVRTAYEAGVNYFDVAPDYGNSQERLGPALEPYRKDVFLSCKTGERKADRAEADLERSLKLQKTDHFDLYQLHHMTTMEEVETIFAPGGVMETLERAKKAGKTRFLGFTAHSVEAAMTLMDRFDFDTMMFPVNYATWNEADFGPQALAKAQEKGLGVIAIKAMCKRPWPEDADRSAHPNCWYEPMTEPSEALQGIRFTLSQAVTTMIHPADEECFKLALRLVPKFTPLTPEEAEEIKTKATGLPTLFPLSLP